MTQPASRSHDRVSLDLFPRENPMAAIPRRWSTAALVLLVLVVVAPVGAMAAPQEPASPSPAEPAKAPPASPAVAQPVADDGPRTEGIIPGILVGPKASATLLFPPSVMVGLELKVIGYIGASFEYGVFPRSQTISSYDLQIRSWSTGLRVYPFRGAFFVGAVLGSYDLTASQSIGAGGTATTLNVTSMYLGPQIGWKWAFDFGLFLGLNLGYGFSLDYKSVLTPANATGDLKTAQENADNVLKTGVPIFTLLELGWLF
jgi:hypothetical protein